jgi:hypothetical protein
LDEEKKKAEEETERLDKEKKEAEEAKEKAAAEEGAK